MSGAKRRGPVCGYYGENQFMGPSPEPVKMFAIAYKATERLPGGRAVGYPGLYKTREEAQGVLDAKLAAGWDWAKDMHVIETTGEIEKVER